MTINIQQPLFGASAKFNVDLMNTTIQPEAFSQIVEAKDEFNAQLAAVDDKKDPLQVNISGDQASIASGHNGNRSVQRGEQGWQDFLGNVAEQVRDFAATLLSPAELKESQMVSVDNLSEALKPVLYRDFNVVAAATDVTGGSAKMHGTTQTKAVIEVNGREFAVQKDVRHGTEKTYSFKELGSDRGVELRIGINSSEQVTRLDYWEKNSQVVDFARLQSNGDDADTLRIGNLIRRLKAVGEALEAGGVFKVAT